MSLSLLLWPPSALAPLTTGTHIISCAEQYTTRIPHTRQPRITRCTSTQTLFGCLLPLRHHRIAFALSLSFLFFFLWFLAAVLDDLRYAWVYVNGSFASRRSSIQAGSKKQEEGRARKRRKIGAMVRRRKSSDASASIGTGSMKALSSGYRHCKEVVLLRLWEELGQSSGSILVCWACARCKPPCVFSCLDR